MDLIKYQNLVEYVKHGAYSESFTKQEKLVLCKFAKKFEYEAKSDSLFYLDKMKDGEVNKCLVILEDQKSTVFDECHLGTYAGHSGRQHHQEDTGTLLLARLLQRHS